MNLKKRCTFIKERLNELYPEPPIPLHHEDPYTLLIAVVLSARSRDERVNHITAKLFPLAKTPESMLNIPLETLQTIIRPCGLSLFKAQSILALSRILLEKYQGKVPPSFEALEALPGVGHKTASVVLCQAFGIPAFPVDTHIFRLAHRWGLSSAKSIARVEKDLKNAFDENDWIPLHLQMIYYARAHCQAHRCFGLSCPICKQCFPDRKEKVLLP